METEGLHSGYSCQKLGVWAGITPPFMRDSTDGARKRDRKILVIGFETSECYNVFHQCVETPINSILVFLWKILFAGAFSGGTMCSEGQWFPTRSRQQSNVCMIVPPSSKRHGLLMVQSCYMHLYANPNMKCMNVLQTKEP